MQFRDRLDSAFQTSIRVVKSVLEAFHEVAAAQKLYAAGLVRRLVEKAGVRIPGDVDLGEDVVAFKFWVERDVKARFDEVCKAAGVTPSGAIQG